MNIRPPELLEPVPPLDEDELELLLEDEDELVLAPLLDELEDDPPHMLLLQFQNPPGVRLLQGWYIEPTLHWPGLQTTLGSEQAGRVEQPQTPPLELLLTQPHMF